MRYIWRCKNNNRCWGPWSKMFACLLWAKITRWSYFSCVARRNTVSRIASALLGRLIIVAATQFYSCVLFSLLAITFFDVLFLFAFDFLCLLLCFPRSSFPFFSFLMHIYIFRTCCTYFHIHQKLLLSLVTFFNICFDVCYFHIYCTFFV